MDAGKKAVEMIPRPQQRPDPEINPEGAPSSSGAAASGEGVVAVAAPAPAPAPAAISLGTATGELNPQAMFQIVQVLETKIDAVKETIVDGHIKASMTEQMQTLQANVGKLATGAEPENEDDTDASRLSKMDTAFKTLAAKLPTSNLSELTKRLGVLTQAAWTRALKADMDQVQNDMQKVLDNPGDFMRVAAVGLSVKVGGGILKAIPGVPEWAKEKDLLSASTGINALVPDNVTTVDPEGRVWQRKGYEVGAFLDARAGIDAISGSVALNIGRKTEYFVEYKNSDQFRGLQFDRKYSDIQQRAHDQIQTLDNLLAKELDLQFSGEHKGALSPDRAHSLPNIRATTDKMGALALAGGRFTTPGADKNDWHSWSLGAGGLYTKLEATQRLHVNVWDTLKAGPPAAGTHADGGLYHTRQQEIKNLSQAVIPVIQQIARIDNFEAATPAQLRTALTEIESSLAAYSNIVEQYDSKKHDQGKLSLKKKDPELQSQKHAIEDQWGSGGTHNIRKLAGKDVRDGRAGLLKAMTLAHAAIGMKLLEQRDNGSDDNPALSMTRLDEVSAKLRQPSFKFDPLKLERDSTFPTDIDLNIKTSTKRLVGNISFNIPDSGVIAGGSTTIDVRNTVYEHPNRLLTGEHTVYSAKVNVQGSLSTVRIDSLTQELDEVDPDWLGKALTNQAGGAGAIEGEVIIEVSKYSPKFLGDEHSDIFGEDTPNQQKMMHIRVYGHAEANVGVSTPAAPLAPGVNLSASATLTREHQKLLLEVMGSDSMSYSMMRYNRMVRLNGRNDLWTTFSDKHNNEFGKLMENVGTTNSHAHREAQAYLNEHTRHQQQVSPEAGAAAQQFADNFFEPLEQYALQPNNEERFEAAKQQLDRLYQVQSNHWLDTHKQVWRQQEMSSNKKHGLSRLSTPTKVQGNIGEELQGVNKLRDDLYKKLAPLEQKMATVELSDDENRQRDELLGQLRKLEGKVIDRANSAEQ